MISAPAIPAAAHVPGLQINAVVRAHANPPMPRWASVLLGTGIVLAAGGAVFLVTRPARAAAPYVPPEHVAADIAIVELGPAASTEHLTQLAYALSHPDATHPPRTDADRAAWDSVASLVRAKLGRFEQGPVEPPKIPPDIDQSSERMLAFIGSLTGDQVVAVRRAVGRQLWDPLHVAALSLNDITTRAALLNVRRAVEATVARSKIDAYAMYREVDAALGEEKLGEFYGILRDTVGRPEV